MFAITLCVLITVSGCYLEEPQSSGRWERFSGGLSSPLKVSLGLPSFEKILNFIDYWDWRNIGMVTPVKDQLNCTAGWAFAIVAATESHRLINMNKSDILSEQFLIDCMFISGNSAGACGDTPILQTYTEIIDKFGGILRSSDYPTYSAKQMKCVHIPYLLPVPLYGFKKVYSLNFHEIPEIMKYHLVAYGPLVARINSKSMRKYKGGIDEPTEEDCDPSPHRMDHSVLIVGFSSYKSTYREVPYWIIKNSWGPLWGVEGYYYLVRGKNACGITNDVSLPIVTPL